MTDIYRSPDGRRAVEAMYRRVLDRWPVPRDERVVSTCQGETFIVASGEPTAPAVVLLHGSGANGGSWLREVGAFSERHRVYAVDVIGEPGFSAPSRPPLSSDAYAAWLDDVWNALGLERARIVGMSLGGWLALDYAIRQPKRVESISLISPSGIGRQNHASMLRIALLMTCGSWGLRRSLRFVGGRADALPAPVADALVLLFRTFRPRLERVPIRSDAELRALTMPVQVIVGADDVLLDSRETCSRVRRLVPHASVTCIEGAGHILPAQTDAIAAFLDRVAETPVEPMRIG